MRLKILYSIVALMCTGSAFAAGYGLSIFHQKRETPSVTQPVFRNSLMNKKSNIEELAPQMRSLEIIRRIGNNEQLYGQLSKLLSGATNLRELALCVCDLINLPKEIGNLTKLWELNLRQNLLICLPTEMGNLTSLRTLDLSLNQVIELPKEIGNLTNLQELYLRMNLLSSLPGAIGNLTNLRMLDLSLNQLTELPKEIGNLSKLQTLDLSLNRLTELPEEMGNLVDLQALDLHDNELAELPKNMGNLVDLQVLNFNRSGVLSVLSFGDELITKLSLSNKGLKQIPFDIVRMKKLTELDLSKNDLEDVPALIVNCKRLRKVNLSENKKIDSLDKVSDGVLGLPELESLVLTTPNGMKEHDRDEISKIRNQRIHRVNENIQDIREKASQKVIKYILWGRNKTKINNQYLKESLEADKQSMKKIQLQTKFLKLMKEKLKAAQKINQKEYKN